MPRIIGLTGGIATGKTTVSDYLSRHHGLTILDADVYAREATSQGSQGLRAIVKRYGGKVMQTADTLDRLQLAQVIFQNPAEKRWLEALIHPYVRDRLASMSRLLAAQSIIVMDIPLLFEAEMTDLVSEIWVVYCHLDQQLTRLMQRSHLTQQEAQLRINSQMSLAQKCDRADVVLDNSGSVEALYTQIDQALQSYSLR
jgi:dephospho-CoA kinase